MTSNPNSRLRHPLTWLLSLLVIALVALVLPSVAHAQSTAPTVSSVAITSTPVTDNTYVTGDTITVSLAFSEAVTVTDTPYVVVDIGGQPRNFKYSGDGASAAAQPFSYTALVGDRDLDGVSLLVNSLTLNGGTIQATDDSANATLTHTTMTFATHKVDTEVTLLSSLADPDASGMMTISATGSATVRIQVGDARDQYDINAITLDVSTASATLDVTVELVGVTDAYADYTYTGSVTAAGSQTFTLTGPAGVKFGNVGYIPGSVIVGKGPAYDIKISGSGTGSIELAGTSQNVSDPGVVSRLFFNRASNVTKPKVGVSGHRGAIPQLIYGDVVSSPPNGTAYAAGDRIDMLIVTTRPMNDPEGLTLPFWLGNGAEHRREAGLVKDIFIEFGYRLFSYTVQAGDTDADGIYIGADPLGDNAGIDSHAADTPAIPAYVRLAANQLPASQSVDGSGSRTCEEVLCSTVLAEVSANDRFSGFSALLLESSASFLTLGASSAWSFEYRGEGDAVVEVVLDSNVDSLELIFIDGLSVSRYNRLALSVDGTVFLLSEANDKGSYGEIFQWLYPGLTWAEGTQIDVKLIETATATFDAASYAKAEGDTFDVTVTLGDSFVNTLTLPVVVAGNGGADDADHSGIPENLAFAPGDTEKTFTVTIVDDEIDDDGESITLSFGAEPHIKSGGTNETAAITITDDDITFTFDPAMVTREINENTGANRNVGSPVTATYTGTGTLTYTLGGTDADSFGIDSSTGQIRTRSGVTYDHEAKPTYTVTVTASDGNGGAATATVTINVNDVNERPRVPLEVVAYPVPRTYDQLFVRWTPPNNAGRPAITGYDIQYEFGDDGIWNNGPQNVDGTSGIITGLLNGAYYDVRVRAKNDEGSGPWSEQYFVITNILDFEVEFSSTIVPDGLVPGDSFHLLFVTDPVRALATYMQYYTDEAADPVFGLPSSNDLFGYWQFLKAVASTRYVDARVITNTTYTNEDKGVPIYWVGGAKAADDYEDFYDGDWDDESARNVRGRIVALPDGVWTGSTADGRELMDGGTSRALGQSPAGYGAPGSSVSGEGPIHSGSTAANTALKPILALSSVFGVVHPPLVANEGQTRDTDDRRSAMRSQAFTTGANRHGYEFSGVVVGKHYKETSNIEVSVYSVDTNGHPDTQLFALSSPDSYTNDTLAFNAPAGATLDPGTTYAAVVQPATSGADVSLYTTDSDSEDDNSLDGWSIANAFHYENGGSWQADSDGKALQIVVRGIAKVGPSLAPTGLTATAVGRDRIDLSWTAPTDDGGSAITGYRIESSADGSTGWADLVADTGPTDTTYSHTGLMPNTTRYYRVSAINGEGTSEPSDTANATTDYPEVTVQFEGGPYTVAEGGTQTVTVVLSEDPFRTTVIPLMATGQNGAESGDYTIPPSVTFSTGQTYAPFTFTATQDGVDDDDESVRLTFGPNLPSKVSAGTMDETTVSITDDDDPRVEVSFGSGTYIVPEGGTQQVTVTLSADPERQVVILITATPQGGAAEDDYSGVPDDVTFNSGQKSKSFTFSATDDTQDEDGEKVLLTFGTLPTRVTAGATGQTTISISDDCADVDIWCATMAFGATVHWEGRYDLQATDVDNREFSHNGADYQLWSTEMHQSGHDSGDDNHVVLPFGIPERTEFLIDFLNLSGPSDQVFDPPNNDWLDWTLHVSTVSDGETLTATLRFSEARKLAGAWWRWSGGDIDDLRRAWKTDQLYKLRLVEDPRSERTPQPLNPPLYLRVQGEVNTTQTWLRWLTPQTRHDRVPPVDSYRIQWKQSSGSWDTASDVSEVTRGPSSQRPVSHYLDGLTPGVEYNIRVIATDSVGDSEPSNEFTHTKLASVQQSLSNTRAEGEPRIDGIPEVGQTLSADTTGIVDVDGLDDVIFQYQWLAGDADIAGSTGSTYTVVSGDVGRAIRVRVAFTDDGGNEETLTSAPTVVTAAGLQLRSATVDLGMLTLTYSKELDTGVSLETAPFAVNVNGSSRSLSGVAVGQSSVLLLLSQPVEAGDMVTVDYTVPDGPDFIRDTLGRKAASFSRQAVTNSTAEDQEDAARGTEDADTEPEYASAVVEPTLTVTVHDVPSSHNGQDAFTFELRFSEDPKPDFSYTTVRDHAFTVAGGSVTYVRRLARPSNMRWEVHVTPDGNGDVNLSLRSTNSCSAQGAICTGEGRKLSGGLQLAVAGPNTPATGAPTISGPAEVGETLTAGTTGIFDDDGLDYAAFAYQWLAGDAEINGATASTYTLAAADAGKAIRVRVSFTDDAGNDEELTSAATGAVAAAPPPPNTPATGAPTISGTLQVGETLTAGTTDISDGDGLGNAVFAYQWLADDSNISGATDSTYTLVAADAGKTIRVRVSFTDDGENGEELASVATGAVAPKPNTPATGAPTISGTARVSETLTASTTDISDADGMTSATFSYQWLADDSNISGATDSTYTLVAADAGKTIRVRVSFTDDGENGEELASAATSAVAAEVVNSPLTASARNVPSSHDGSAAFTFELRFSDELPLSYVTLRDHVFTVTGGSVTYVRRLAPPSNMRWEVHVTPDSDGSLVIVLPVTGDCEADGAICTEDGRRLSNRLEVTVNGP